MTAAEDYLQDEQFMLPTSHLYGMQGVDLVHGSTFKSTNPPEQYDAHYKWGALRSSIQERGITKPIMVSRRELVMGQNIEDPKSFTPAQSDKSVPFKTVMNGHHRAMVALEQGHLFVPAREEDVHHDQTDVGDDWHSDIEEHVGNHNMDAVYEGRDLRGIGGQHDALLPHPGPPPAHVPANSRQMAFNWGQRDVL